MAQQTTTITEEELVALLQQQDTKAMNLLYEKYSVALYGVIFRLLGDKDLAEEKLQDCFLKIWQNAASYDPKKGRLFTWMIRIARNTAIDGSRSKFYKQQKRVHSLESNRSIIEKANRIEMNTDEIGIKELIHKLNTKYAAVIDVVYFQGFTQSEAAKELNIPLGTVKTRIRTAIKFLREMVRNK